MASLLDSYGHAGEETSFDVLYRTYKSEVQRLAAYLLRNTADAEDASQTVFLNVLRALRQGVKPAEPRAWLLAITRNVCFSRGRASACRPSEVELDPETLADSSDEDAPGADDIVGALARMLPNQRTALILRDFRGVPRAEIAELLTLSPTGVEAMLTRARTSFREELEAGERPLACADTRALVEEQLAGRISAGERHSLRAHIRHCSSCSTLARAIRSSGSKLASLLWPAGLVSRLAELLSQAPAAHVAAVASSALVASVAVPTALVHAPATTQPVASSSASAPAPAVVTHVQAPSPARPAPTSRTEPASARARTKPHRATPAHTPKRPAAQVAVHAAPLAAAATTTASIPAQAEPAQATHALSRQSPIVSQPYATPPTSHAGTALAPTSKSAGRGSKRGKSRRSPSPIDRMPDSTAPAAEFPAPENRAENGAGPGFTAGKDAEAAAVPAKSAPALAKYPAPATR